MNSDLNNKENNDKPSGLINPMNMDSVSNSETYNTNDQSNSYNIKYNNNEKIQKVKSKIVITYVKFIIIFIVIILLIYIISKIIR